MQTASAAPPVYVYDRGKTLVGVYPAEQVMKWVDQPWTTVVRSKDGRIRRIYWLEPPPEYSTVDDGRGSALGGEHYVYHQQIWPDTIYRVWTHRESRFLISNS